MNETRKEAAPPTPSHREAAERAVIEAAKAWRDASWGLAGDPAVDSLEFYTSETKAIMRAVDALKALETGGNDVRG